MQNGRTTNSEWRDFEKLVARIEKLLAPSGASIKSPDRLPDKTTGQLREVDGTIRYQVGSVPFKGQGWIRVVYFTVLISHTILAATIVPLVLMTLIRALKGNFERHKRIARWTLPLWLYVSITGVIVYWMLYGLDLPR